MRRVQLLKIWEVKHVAVRGVLVFAQVVESREIGAGFEAMLRMPELLSNRNQSTIRFVAVSSDGAEMLAIGEYGLWFK